VRLLTLVFAGKVGTGFSRAEGRVLVAALRDQKRSASPFRSLPTGARRGAVFVEPTRVAHINFAEWTPDGLMRHPSFQGLREDKPARDVVREREKPPPAPTSPRRERPRTHAEKDIEVAGVRLTHPDKLLYPDAGITKRDLAAYYEKIAPRMLPHIAGRPLSLVRCPEGEGKPCFFQRHGSDKLSPHVRPVIADGTSEPYLMIENVQGLIALVQMGALEIHAWGSHAGVLDKPDRLIFDLDPAPEVPFEEVKRAAQEIKERLSELRLVSFPKVTGGKGLHVVVPFRRGPSWDKIKAFARGFAEELVEEFPRRFTVNSRKAARKGKIFIDYLRNSESASAIAPYSTRARPGAPLALPLDWKDLAPLAAANVFRFSDALKRRTDPWQRMLASSPAQQKLPNL
jgi:bifunctional non-homologous end joining protein LigD